ncbi:MAG: right-handed parallel beta-helix repeat-containing protein, partial [bacterium]
MLGRTLSIAFTFVCLLATSVAPALGGTVYVDGSVAGPGSGTFGDPYKELYPTALGAAAVGDTVLVAAETYPGTVHILKDLVLVGADPATTIIDGGNGTRAVRIAGATTAATIVQGFTIQAGEAAEGAGILMEKSASVRNCVIAGNVTTSDPGAGVQVYNGASGSFTNCTFAANVSNGPGGGGALSLQGLGASATLTNCILWDNTPNQIHTAGGTVTVTYSDVEGGGFAGVGNIDADPLFTDAVNGDFTLSCVSPCIDAGNPAGTDMGAIEALCLPVTVSGT